ncbi:carboxylesterase/lipase family protein [Streptomyces sp. XD-27]|uniref:carboxylesterase/lipase family protein n=1 Tax=Streptomyces sp. XD-27 TaxID=3062779 RepID=UPI0026F45165|nr:carboxylesterase family protein [Streptomyces sp. XD-27]WKX68894.1 carboxylesterase family protein [Streptomyces sp. XD-27]
MDVTALTRYGRVRGRHGGGIAAFLGIPYAAPPFGARRMRPPRPPEPWTGERDATEYGDSAPQPGYVPPMSDLFPNLESPGDDCLNLNIWTPAPGRTGGGLPVMVWIHGGGFRYGAGSLPLYEGGRLAADGTVCVTLNHRLGPEGFLLLPDGTANLGLLDVIAALEWVQDNIAAFGGDPGRVTVFGESSGAISVVTLMAMPRARGLFHRAIAQSGAGHHTHTEDVARRLTARLAALAGVEPTAEALTAAAPQRLIDANAALGKELSAHRDRAVWGEAAGGVLTLLPVVDGATLPARPVDAIAAGAGADVDLLVGTNTDEFRFFLVPLGLQNLITDDVLRQVTAEYGLADEAGLATYRAARPGATPGDLLSAALTDHAYRVPALRLAEGRAAHGADTHVYEFAWRTPALDGTLGACHAAEIGFVFGNLSCGLTGETAPGDLSDQMRAAWTAFARDGRPGTAGGLLPEWPAYGTRRSVMRLGDGPPAVHHDPAAAERRLWEGIR